MPSVLIIEDDEDGRRAMAKLFARADWKVFEAADGDAGVEWLPSLSHHPAKAPADQDHRGVGTGLCGRSRERAGSGRGRVSAQAHYMGSPAGVNRSTPNTDSKTTTRDGF